MYVSFYKLKELPFTLTCDEKYFYESSVHAEALANMIYTVQNRKGMVLITGDVGVGKTFLANMVGARLEANCVFVHLQNPPQSGKQLLKALASQVGMRVDFEADKITLLEDIERHLTRMQNRGRLVVMVLDEAQDLPDDTLKEIRLLSNWEINGQRLLQIVLVGQPEIRNKLLEPAWESLRQRIVLSYQLAHLSATDVSNYIDYRIQVAADEGCLAKFSDEAKDDVYHATDGIPRLINILCDSALLIGYTQGVYCIEHSLMTEVLKDTSLWNLPGTTPPGRAVSPSGQLQPPEQPIAPEQPVTPEPPVPHITGVAEHVGFMDAMTQQLIEAERASHDVVDVTPSAQPVQPTAEPPVQPPTEPAQLDVQMPSQGLPQFRIDMPDGQSYVPSEPPAPSAQPQPEARPPQQQLTPQQVLEAVQQAAPEHRVGPSITHLNGRLKLPELIIAQKDRGSPITEEYRGLRTNLLAASPDERFCYLITSPEPGDGKTITCLNLAMVMIERVDFRTIVVDCDMRKGSMAKYLNGRQSPGMADLLRGTVTLKEVIQPTAYPNLFFISAGTARPDEVGELIGGPEVGDVVSDLRRSYDYVIFDTPPINTVPDAGMLGLSTGDALLVVRMHRTHRDSVDKATRLLGAANVKLAGVVLTNRKHFLPSPMYR